MATVKTGKNVIITAKVTNPITGTTQFVPVAKASSLTWQSSITNTPIEVIGSFAMADIAATAWSGSGSIDGFVYLDGTDLFPVLGFTYDSQQAYETNLKLRQKEDGFILMLDSDEIEDGQITRTRHVTLKYCFIGDDSHSIPNTGLATNSLSFMYTEAPLYE